MVRKPTPAERDPDAERWLRLRQRMVERQLRRRGIDDPHVLAAMGRVPRERFVPPEYRAEAYEDCALPIGHGQTISQPYMVAIMASLVGAAPGRRILEIGTGSGYAAAVLAEAGARVYTIERVRALAERAERVLTALGYAPDRVTIGLGDGYLGWPAEAPFDGIVVAAAPPGVPQALLEQLRLGGCLVLPVDCDRGGQMLTRITREPDGFRSEEITPVRFVPMVGGSQP